MVTLLAAQQTVGSLSHSPWLPEQWSFFDFFCILAEGEVEVAFSLAGLEGGVPIRIFLGGFLRPAGGGVPIREKNPPPPTPPLVTFKVLPPQRVWESIRIDLADSDSRKHWFP